MKKLVTGIVALTLLLTGCSGNSDQESLLKDVIDLCFTYTLLSSPGHENDKELLEEFAKICTDGWTKEKGDPQTLKDALSVYLELIDELRNK